MGENYIIPNTSFIYCRNVDLLKISLEHNLECLMSSLYLFIFKKII